MPSIEYVLIQFSNLSVHGNYLVDLSICRQLGPALKALDSAGLRQGLRMYISNMLSFHHENSAARQILLASPFYR